MQHAAKLLTRRSALGLIAAANAGLISPVLAATKPLATVYKDPGCGCCTGWVAHLRAAGFPVNAIDTRELVAIKQRLSVPEELASCHTAQIGGYVVEGHVPAAAIDRLLAERPKAIGLAVPGMPVGSPGMEGGEPEVYEVFLFDGDGRRSFGRFKGAGQI